MRFTAVFALNPNSDEGFKWLEGFLKDDDPGVRIMAAPGWDSLSQPR